MGCVVVGVYWCRWCDGQWCLKYFLKSKSLAKYLESIKFNVLSYFWTSLQKLRFTDVPFHSQRHYSPGLASVSFKSFLHPSRFRANTVQFPHPNFAASSFTPSFQCNLGLPLGRFPPGSLRRTLLDKSSSSWRMTCPAHISLLNLQNITMSFSPHNWYSSWLVLIRHLPPSVTGP